ncbi:hypothetical protein QLX08_011509 [Tetragonisca angustula]|uniref:Uncharacterized protein n=1 Tax=Tetragonisca angustula TaxID=166442 RepID=A0AAW0Z863_9HYME
MATTPTKTQSFRPRESATGSSTNCQSRGQSQRQQFVNVSPRDKRKDSPFGDEGAGSYRGTNDQMAIDLSNVRRRRSGATCRCSNGIAVKRHLTCSATLGEAQRGRESRESPR